MKTQLILSLLLWGSVGYSQLNVTVSPPKVTGQKAVVPLAMKNGYAEKVESARAAVFLLDEQGQMVGQSARWVIGGGRETTGLAPGATNAFNFVVPLTKPVATTNLTARVNFSRVVLEGGKLADVAKEVQVKSDSK